ncbi:hypothetical protein BSLG_005203 [Batrachochytrium salamandrivorans]|nr:hypothetical protein BASA60_009938 [Batrachochytrium salamandrivorans]KAH9252693.1 hypothetical protein BASA81_009387 [Batrachochytrium salamandrivorans]KAH9267503.1 hypothetical protein BASA83_009892 [Batrachochytrium salamandrivorans]KAJ1340210.1 hypothetical protein BSLG_005203 [Batrachochytrium salamandrivorans]
MLRLVIIKGVAAGALALGTVWINLKYAFRAYRTRTEEELGLEEFESFYRVGHLKLNRFLLVNPTHTHVCYILVHGFGGQLAQWYPIIRLLSASGSVFGLETVGHGQSQISFDPNDYLTESIVESIATAFVTSCPQVKKVVLVGHSLGCAHSVRLLHVLESKGVSTDALILMAPKSAPENIVSIKKTMQKMPVFAVGLFRFFETFNGPYSISVNRMYHKADLTMRFRQLRWNQTTPSLVVKLSALGISLPPENDYTRIHVPILVLYGLHDNLTKYDPNVKAIERWAVDADKTIYGVEASHSLIWEAKEQVMKHIVAFLEAHKIILSDS